MNDRTEREHLIVFADLTRYQANARTVPDRDLAELMNDYYVTATRLIEDAGGRVVKPMGDALLAVWPDDAAARGLRALPAIKRAVDAHFAKAGWDSRLVIKAHYGRVVAGAFGADERFDVIGNEVNVAATLPARTITISPEAFRKLPTEERRSWKKHTERVVYIPVDGPRP